MKNNIYTIKDIKNIAQLLLNGAIGILPTDTIYGVHCMANDNNLVKKIYEIKQRPAEMPYITLVSSYKDLDKFNISVSTFEKIHIDRFWPGPNTLIFKTRDADLRSFRQPNNSFLQELLSITGPLVSTSANLHGKPFVKNINEAINIFESTVDFFVDGGELNNPPSSIYNLLDDKIVKIR